MNILRTIAKFIKEDLFFTLVAIVIIGTSIIAITTPIYRSWMNNKIVARGIATEAIITNVEQTNTYVNNMPEIKIGLEYVIAGSKVTSSVKKVIEYTEIPKYQVGSKIMIIYDPQDTTKAVVQ